MTLVPLTSGAYQSESVIANAQRCVNLYPELNPKATTPPVPVTHYQRPGKVLLNTLQPVPVPVEDLFFVVGFAPLEGGSPVATKSVLADASEWTDISPSSPDPGEIYGIVKGNDILIGGGFDGDLETGVILRSDDDGETWNSIANGFTSVTAKVLTVAFGNNKFLAGGFFNTGAILQVSVDDGLTWVTKTAFTGGFSHVNTAYYDSTNSQYIIGGKAASGAIYTSPDADTWTSRTNGFLDVFGFASNGARLVAVGTVGSAAMIQTSDDAGVTWATKTQSFGAVASALSVAFGNSTFVTVGQGAPGGNSCHIEISTDNGDTWVQQTNPFGLGILYSVSFGSGVFIITGFSSNTAVIATSPDGVSWTIRTSAFPAGNSVGRGVLAI